jgi:hypothetical protein
MEIYNKFYRRELCMNFAVMKGNYEWLRWVLSFFIGVAIGCIGWAVKASITVVLKHKSEIVQGQMAKGEVFKKREKRGENK